MTDQFNQLPLGKGLFVVFIMKIISSRFLLSPWWSFYRLVVVQDRFYFKNSPGGDILIQHTTRIPQSGRLMYPLTIYISLITLLLDRYVQKSLEPMQQHKSLE